MKRILIAATLVAASIFTPLMAADVGVSLSIGQPGFYGRIDIGDFPPPQLVYRQPVMIVRGDRAREPIYLHVPPGHAKHWSRHCHEYNACGERVYFVQDEWYQQKYVPRYQERQRERREGRHGDHYDRHNDHHDGRDR